MAISKAAPDIGLRLVGMADGSTAIATERGELLANQCGVVLKSSPGGATIATVEFVVDHHKFRIDPPSGESTIKIDASRVKMADLEEEFAKEVRKIINRVNDAVE